LGPNLQLGLAGHNFNFLSISFLTKRK